uniref:Uncharacterized protein n=1 Tax=Arundo donax TaxID=35708 RepID=A0A0A9F2H2_ARUDO
MGQRHAHLLRLPCTPSVQEYKYFWGSKFIHKYKHS